jgi:hypothetical protein
MKEIGMSQETNIDLETVLKRIGTLEAEILELRAAVSKCNANIREMQDVREIKHVWDKWHYSCTGGFNGKQAGRMEALECLSDDATIECENLHGQGDGSTGADECHAYWEYFYGDDGPLPYVFQTSLADDHNQG